jgi:hypothetical protein
LILLSAASPVSRNGSAKALLRGSITLDKVVLQNISSFQSFHILQLVDGICNHHSRVPGGAGPLHQGTSIYSPLDSVARHRGLYDCRRLSSDVGESGKTRLTRSLSCCLRPDAIAKECVNRPAASPRRRRTQQKKHHGAERDDERDKSNFPSHGKIFSNTTSARSTGNRRLGRNYRG